VKQRFCRAVVLVATMVACSAGTAHAGLISWLDQLSGPGPFWIFDGSYGIKCSGDPVPSTERRKAETFGFGIRGGCEARRSLEQRTWTWYLSAGAGFATENHLNYSDAGSHPVRLVRFGTSVDRTVHRTLDLGAGIGGMYFAGPDFSNFTRMYLEPVRVNVRPLVLWPGAPGARRERRGALSVYINWNILVGTVEGKDFGAPLDTFRAHTELNRKEYGLILDIGRLLSW
jgi:hypothetical protein